MRKVYFVFFVAFTTLFLSAISSCKKDEKTVYTYQVSRLKFAYQQMQRVLLTDFVSSSVTMRNRINLFHDMATQNNLEGSRQEWKNTSEKFTLLGPYKSGYASADIGYHSSKSFFDFYPINYRYIDYSEDQPAGGIINDTENHPSIQPLHLLHQEGGEANCTVGFHVIEFLLWGEDLSLSGPGHTRDYKDYVTGGGGINMNRRRAFLFESMQLLAMKIEELKTNDAYERSIKQLSSKDFMNLMIGSLQYFIKEEIVQKDILLPVTTQNHHLEICDFSDHTLPILKKKVEAIRLLFNGESLFPGNNTDYFLMNFMTEIMPEEAGIIQAKLNEIDAVFNTITVTFENAVITPVHAAKLQSIADKLMVIHAQLDLLLAKFN